VRQARIGGETGGEEVVHDDRRAERFGEFGALVHLLRSRRGDVEIKPLALAGLRRAQGDRKSTRLNSSHLVISYAAFCLKKKNYAPRTEYIPPEAKKQPAPGSHDQIGWPRPSARRRMEIQPQPTHDNRRSRPPTTPAASP